MAYVVRTKDNPGDVGRAADQQQSVDNETALYAAVLGAGPVSTGGVVRQWIDKTGLADNVATNVFTITTTNEAANDGGVFTCDIDSLCVHGAGPSGDTSCMAYQVRFGRALHGNGTPGTNTAVVLSTTSGANASSTVGNKNINTITVTVVETSEYVQTIQFQIDLGGAVITTADVHAFVTLYYAGFTTPPVITVA